MTEARNFGAHYLLYTRFARADDRIGNSDEWLDQDEISRLGIDSGVIQVMLIETSTQYLIDTATIRSRGGLLTFHDNKPADLIGPPLAKYARSLEQIKRTKVYGKRTKSGVMVGLGETREEMLQIMDDLREHGCDVLTIGQYLQPTKMHLEVAEFVHPDQFAEYKEEGLKRGFAFVESGPLVRSSYHAERHL